MSAVTALIEDIQSFRTTHGCHPKRIRMHPFDVHELQSELVTKPLADAGNKPAGSGPDYAMTFLGVPIYLSYEAVVARPWLDL